MHSQGNYDTVSNPLKTWFFCLGMLLATMGIMDEIQAQTRVLILGDSLTAGFGVAEPEAFPALIQAKLNAEGYKVSIINAGISGSTSSSAKSRLKWRLKAKPHILLLALGANDGLRGLNIKAMQTNLDEAIVLAKDQKVLVLLAGMKMFVNLGADYTKRYERVFVELADKHKIKRIPFLLDQVVGKPELNLNDGIHPNAAGHRIIANRVLKHLKAMLPPKDQSLDN